MINRSLFNKSLADKLFQFPTTLDLPVVELNFELPTQVSNLKYFLTSHAGQLYREGVLAIIKKIKAWAEKEKLATTSLKELKTIFTYKGKEKEYNLLVYPLLTEGVKNLAQIVELCETSILPIESRRTIIKNLLGGLNICPPGIYTNIQHAVLNLSGVLDVAIVAIKRQFAVETALALLPKYQFYHAGNEIHYVNKIINHFADSLGLEYVEDKYTNSVNLSSGLLKEFPKKIAEAFTLENIIESLLVKLNFQQFAHIIQHQPEMAMQEIKRLQAQLNVYGIDEGFNFNELFDQDKLMEDEFVLVKDAEQFLIISLLHQLASHGFVNLKENLVKNTFEDGTELFFLKQDSNKLAYIILKDKSRLPFTVYQKEYEKEFLLNLLYKYFASQEDLKDLLQQSIYQLIVTRMNLPEVIYILPKLNENHLELYLAFLRDHCSIVFDINAIRTLFGSPQINAYIIEKFINNSITLANDTAQQVLIFAVKNNFPDIIPLAVKLGANINVQLSKQKFSDTLLDRALLSENQNMKTKLKIARNLIENNFNINVTNQFGYTPLYTYLLNCKNKWNVEAYTFIKFLLTNGADVNKCPYAHHSPLYVLLNCYRPMAVGLEIFFNEVVDLFLKLGADANPKFLRKMNSFYSDIDDIIIKLLDNDNLAILKLIQDTLFAKHNIELDLVKLEKNKKDLFVLLCQSAISQDKATLLTLVKYFYEGGTIEMRQNMHWPISFLAADNKHEAVQFLLEIFPEQLKYAIYGYAHANNLSRLSLLGYRVDSIPAIIPSIRFSDKNYDICKYMIMGFIIGGEIATVENIFIRTPYLDRELILYAINKGIRLFKQEYGDAKDNFLMLVLARMQSLYLREQLIKYISIVNESLSFTPEIILLQANMIRENMNIYHLNIKQAVALMSKELQIWLLQGVQLVTDGKLQPLTFLHIATFIATGTADWSMQEIIDLYEKFSFKMIKQFIYNDLKNASSIPFGFFATNRKQAQALIPKVEDVNNKKDLNNILEQHKNQEVYPIILERHQRRCKF